MYVVQSRAVSDSLFFYCFNIKKDPMHRSNIQDTYNDVHLVMWLFLAFLMINLMI